ATVSASACCATTVPTAVMPAAATADFLTNPRLVRALMESSFDGLRRATGPHRLVALPLPTRHPSRGRALDSLIDLYVAAAETDHSHLSPLSAVYLACSVAGAHCR